MAQPENSMVPSILTEKVRPIAARLLDTNTVSILVIVTIIVLGAYFRIVDLGNPGFWGDEETSSIPARSLALNRGPVFESGMEYRRALPHTYMSAWSARIWGIDKDLPYRIPSAALGIATLVLVFFSTRQLLGFKVALVATALLAFSEWHIVLSRTARMYGPLLFFSTLFCFVALNWNFEKSKQFLFLILTIACFAIAVTFNFLAIIVLPIVLVPMIFLEFERSKLITSITLTGLLGFISIYYYKFFISSPYKEMRLGDASFQDLQLTKGTGFFEPLKMLSFDNTDIVFALLGIAVGLTIFLKLTRQISFSQYRLPMSCLLIASLAYGLLASLGSAYGVSICIIFMLVFLSHVANFPPKTYFKILAILLVVPILILVFNVYRHGLTSGLKVSLDYPFPYLLYQFLNFPGIIILFLVGILASIIRPENRRSTIIKVLTVIILTPPAIFGLISGWDPPRFFVTVYPLLVIVAAFGLVALSEMIETIRRSRWLTLSVLVLIPASGILGGHGIPRAKAVSPSDYGAPIYGNHVMGIRYPDHRSHGCFVKKHLEDGDIIVAEDALQMYWYIGRVDFWLRSPSNIGSFLYDDGGEIRDFYVNSKPTSNNAIYHLRRNSKDRIWVITSGETQQHLDHFLPIDSLQRQWLSDIANSQSPVLNGRDGLSATYCLNCNLDFGVRNPWDYDC